jgi:hypothetical protein
VTVPNQTYCSRRECQQERRRGWQHRKIHEDPDYRANQTQAQRLWRDQHPEYWRDYRARNPEYVERNRQQQQDRNQRRGAVIAKMDALETANPLISGTYRLVHLCGEGVIAKMDEYTVKIELISSS